MPFIHIENAKVYYELHGQGEPLVLISGHTCDHIYWEVVLPKLAERFQVLVFDNLAVGQTKDTNTPLTIESMAEFTMALITKLDLKRPHILGQSMGGCIAQVLAYRYPARINKLMILNSVAKFNTRTLKALDNVINLRKANVPLDLIIDTVLPWLFSYKYLQTPKNIETFKNAAINDPYPQSVQDQERQYHALLSFDATSWVQGIKSPTFVIVSTEDIIALPSESEDLANEIKGAKLLFIPGGHASATEAPLNVHQTILDILCTSN